MPLLLLHTIQAWLCFVEVVVGRSVNSLGLTMPYEQLATNIVLAPFRVFVKSLGRDHDIFEKVLREGYASRFG